MSESDFRRDVSVTGIYTRRSLISRVGWGCAERPLGRRELLLEATFLDLDQDRGAREEGEIGRQKNQVRVEEPVRDDHKSRS